MTPSLRAVAGPIRRSAPRAGFTLIELLVVISVIALLISILLPALAKAREATMAVQCATNARSIAIAHLLYGADNKTRFAYPGVASAGIAATAITPGVPAPGSNNVSWDDLLALGGYDGRKLDMSYADDGYLRYVAGIPTLDPPSRDHMRKVYTCPAYGMPSGFITDRFFRAYRMNSGGFVDQRPTPYDTNVDGYRFMRGIGSDIWSRMEQSVQEPAKTILLAEGNTTSGTSEMGNTSNAVFATPHHQEGYWSVSAAYNQVKPFHSSGNAWNYAFVDGHVALLNPHLTYGTGTYGGPSIDGLSTAARADRASGGMWSAIGRD